MFLLTESNTQENTTQNPFQQNQQSFVVILTVLPGNLGLLSHITMLMKITALCLDLEYRVSSLSFLKTLQKLTNIQTEHVMVS